MLSGIAKCERKNPPQTYPFLSLKFGRRRLQLTSALRQYGKMYGYGNIVEIVFIRTCPSLAHPFVLDTIFVSISNICDLSVLSLPCHSNESHQISIVYE